MNPRRIVRFAAIVSLSCVLSLGACARKAPSPSSTPPRQVHWPAVDGADSYLVRAWSGYRLLFAQSSSDTVLSLDQNMLRVLAGCDSVSLEVKALDASDAPVAGGHRRYALPQFRRKR